MQVCVLCTIAKNRRTIDSRMDTTCILVIAFGILVSLQLLNSISTCGPSAYTHTYYYYNAGGHINNHSSASAAYSHLKVNNHSSGVSASSDVKESNHSSGAGGDSMNTHINNHSRDVSMDDMHHLYKRHIYDGPLVPAIFAFGDSTVDAGNNNHLITVSRSNFAPYGRDLVQKRPTGRFCNGKLVPDYIATKLGLESRMIAYLDLKKNNMKQRLGCLNMPLHLEVSFGSASSGFYDTTATHFNALPLKKQITHFKEYRQKLIQALGEADAMEVLANAIFIMSTGTNDYLNNYLVNPYLRSKYSLPQFQDLILDLCAEFIKELHGLGARKIGVVSLPPFGCLPAIRTIYRNGGAYGCVDHLNTYATNFNEELQRSLFPLLQHSLSGLHLAYMDSNSILLDIVNDPFKYGLKQVRKACCGSGKLEVGIFCNKFSVGTCEDATYHAFWDSFHPTDRTNEILATKLLEQIWEVFNLDEPYVYYYRYPPTNVHRKEESLLSQIEQWRCNIFLVGGLLYLIHLITQFFPKIIDLGI